MDKSTPRREIRGGKVWMENKVNVRQEASS